MSADNGVYILKTIKENSNNFEYRVAHAQNIEDVTPNIKYEDLHRCSMVYIFSRSKIFTDKKEADIEAKKIYDEIMNSDCPIVEHGICIVNVDEVFPKMTYREAVDKENKFWKSKKLTN